MARQKNIQQVLPAAGYQNRGFEQRPEQLFSCSGLALRSAISPPNFESAGASGRPNGKLPADEQVTS